MTKIDLVRFEQLNQEDQMKINQLLKDNNVSLITMSNATGEGI